MKMTHAVEEIAVVSKTFYIIKELIKDDIWIVLGLYILSQYLLS